VLLGKAYNSILPEKAAEYLGLSNDVVIQGSKLYQQLVSDYLALQQEKWTYDVEKKLLCPPKIEKRMLRFHLD